MNVWLTREERFKRLRWKLKNQREEEEEEEEGKKGEKNNNRREERKQQRFVCVFV